MKKMTILCLLSLIGVLAAAPAVYAAFTEPTMLEYKASPMFADQSITPNIMIMLDNSGSMNEPAYSGSFTGAPYNDNFYPVVGYDDDMEGDGSPDVSPDDDVNDLDLGRYAVGIRFQSIEIPQGAVIRHAYIDFTAASRQNTSTDLIFEIEDSDNSAPFSSTNPITERAAVSDTVPWNSVPAWSRNRKYTTPDLADLVQAIVNRQGWTQGNALTFRLTGDGLRAAYSRSQGNNEALRPVLRIECDAIQGSRYYGYFNPDCFYQYVNSESTFVVRYKKERYNESGKTWTVRALGQNGLLADTTATLDAATIRGGLWDGNWLNWASMRRIDILRKVFVGGWSETRDKEGVQTIRGEVPNASAYYADWAQYSSTDKMLIKTFDADETMPVNPHVGRGRYYMDSGGRLIVRKGEDAAFSYVIRVKKEPAVEPEDVNAAGKPVGVLQRIGDKARWGNAWFNGDDNNGGRSDFNQNGGKIFTSIGSASVQDMVLGDENQFNGLHNKRCDGNTPLAETLYVIMQYFRQENLEITTGYPSGCLPDPVQKGGEHDPYYYSALDEMAPCAKSFVILLTDGASTYDGFVPSYLMDTDNDGDATSGGESYPRGSTYLDDVAYWAHTKDLRPGDGDLEGDQTLTIYTIYAFGSDDNARRLLKDTAINGGFRDLDGDGKPSSAEEYDKDKDGVPDNYFEAGDGYALERRLIATISDIIKETASGTAASVQSGDSRGAGNTIQAYFKPRVAEGYEEAAWLGYMRSMWVDPWGNLREDSNGNKRLDLTNETDSNEAGDAVDRIIVALDDGGNTIVRKYAAHFLYNPNYDGSDKCRPPYKCDVAFDPALYTMEDITPIFEAAERLTKRDPASRKIYTSIESDHGSDRVMAASKMIDFNTDAADVLTPYLGVRDGGVWGDDGAGLGASLSARVSNIINWIRGTDVEGLRNRTLAGVTWRLGDIVHSTPMTVGPASEYYHAIYQDDDYMAYLRHTQSRETVVYAGANDGMLHAFTSGVRKKDEKNRIYYEKQSGTQEEIGDELWAYIPMSLLPHLKWTAHRNYSHTYYVDGPVRVFDAKILPDDTHYTDKDADPDFGTFLVFGLNLGGKPIAVNEAFSAEGEKERTFHPTYVMLDITNPREPRLMWERSYDGLGLTTVTPQPAHVGKRDGSGTWYLVFGSGPTSYSWESDQPGRVYVVDMLTGEPLGGGANPWLAVSETNSYFTSPLVIDRFQSHNSDAVFIANNYRDAKTDALTADIWKISVPCDPCAWSQQEKGGTKEPGYNDDPAQWVVNKAFFSAGGPVSASLTPAVDDERNLLLFIGTGRYLTENDKTSQDQQYFYCVKDPFYNENLYKKSYYHNFGQSSALKQTDLKDVTNAETLKANGAKPTTVKIDNEEKLLDAFILEMRMKTNGWYHRLGVSENTPSERIITQTAVLGGAAVTTAYTPSRDICGSGGESVLMGVHYETGTGGYHQLFTIQKPKSGELGGKPAEIIAIRDDTPFIGMPSPKVGIHTGMGGGALVSFQDSSGAPKNERIKPPLYFHNIITEWWDDPNQAPEINSECKW